MKAFPRPTIRDVAAQAGVHFTTASRAIKGDARISRATTQKVRKAALAVGYEPDPMMSAFSSYRQKRSHPAFHGTLAWVTNFKEPSGWHAPGYDNYRKGAEQRGAEVGYKIEDFWLHEPKMNARRASQILLNRGIRGLLLCPQPKPWLHLSIRWEEFSVISFGYSMARPKVNLVAPAHFNAVVTAFRHLRALGHRRIGFACDARMDARNFRLWSSAFLSERNLLAESRAVPLFLPDAFAPAPFEAWFRRHRPTAVITSYLYAGPPEWLAQAGYRVPQDVSLAVLNLEGASGGLAGIDEQSVQLGVAAVNLLTGMLVRGERGVPEAPLRLLIEGKWLPGKSARRLAA